jgi:hypothetical protein
MVCGLPWEVGSGAANQEMTCCNGTKRFVIECRKAHHWALPWANTLLQNKIHSSTESSLTVTMSEKSVDFERNVRPQQTGYRSVRLKCVSCCIRWFVKPAPFSGSGKFALCMATWSNYSSILISLLFDKKCELVDIFTKEFHISMKEGFFQVVGYKLDASRIAVMVASVVSNVDLIVLKCTLCSFILLMQ